MRSSVMKFALIAAVAVCVCGAPLRASRTLANFLNSEKRASQNSLNSVIFTPHDLPCGYKIVQTTHVTASGEQEEQLITYYVRGNLFRVVYYIDDGEFVEEVVFRSDIQFPDPDSDKTYIEEFHGATMAMVENLLFEIGAVDDAMDENIYMFVDEIEFLNVTNSTWDGKPCQLFFDYDEESEFKVYFYADFDGYVLGFNESYPQYTALSSVEYFLSSDLSDFVFNKTLFSDCNDSRAFNVPTYDPCANPHPSSSSQPASSSFDSSSDMPQERQKVGKTFFQSPLAVPSLVAAVSLAVIAAVFLLF